MSNSQKTRQLEHQLAELDNPSDITDHHKKIDALNELAWTLFYSDNQQDSERQAYELSETALALAESSENGNPPYQAGMAYSLRTQGHLNMRSGDYSTGLTQLLKALRIFESLYLVDGLADVFDGIASIYFFIGDHSQALDMAYKQLATAQQIGDKQRIANANNNLASIYFKMGDHGRVLDLLKRNLKLAKEIKYDRMECATLVKLQQIYQTTGEDQPALKYGLRAVQMSRELGHYVFEIRALRLLALSYLGMNDKSQTVSFLEQALDLSRKFESKPNEVLVLLTMGEAYRDLGHFEQAREALQQALMFAQSLNAKNFQSEGHLLLSELYEGHGDSAQALHHFKQYYAIKMFIAGEESDQRVNLLEVLHEVETIKKKAEIAQARTLELQHNISEKEKAQRLLQRQLEYARTLSACSKILLSPAESEGEYHDLLAQALQRIIEPSQVTSIYLLENIEDPQMGLSSRIVVRTYASDSLVEADERENLPNYRETFLQLPNKNLSDPLDPQTDIIPWSLFPADIPQQLVNGVPVSRSIAELQTANPLWGEFLSDVMQILSVQFFPIILNSRWWGTLSLENRIDRRQWDADEMVMVQAATEIVKNSLQLHQTQVELRSLNNQLGQKVESRTAELRNSVKKLSKEVKDRERAEESLQEMMSSLEQHLIARTNELATFFDLILMAGQGVDLSEIFEYVAPQVMEVTQSHAVSIDVMEADGDHMHLIGRANIPEQAPWRVKISEFPPEIRRWMQTPNEPLLISDLEKEIPSFSKAFKFSTYKTLLIAQIMVGDQIEGVLGCYRTERGGYGVDEVALVTAVAQQLGLILEINHLRQQGRNMAVFEERERLARELHDSVAQRLYSLNLFAHAGQDAAEDGDLEEIHLRFQQVEENALDALREMRLMLYQLRPLALENRSLASAFEERFDLVERRLGITASIQADHHPELTPEVEQELFYIISEALNNTLKHAQATEVKVGFSSSNDHLLVTIRDNGRGFDLRQPHSGMGLENICLRTEKIDGLVELDSAIGQGTTIRINL